MVDLKMEIPREFLEGEERCGYYVSQKMKEVWAVQLDLMAELDRVCRKHHLTYIAGAGTLLGAVRHQGFIPWDDDMDFYMLRKDYDRLIRIKGAFKQPYFLQNAYTDPELMRTFSRLRNSNTTACSAWEEGYNINKGIFIDIFPLDGVNESFIKNKLQKLKNDYYLLGISEKHQEKGKGFVKTVRRKVMNMLITLRRGDKRKTFRKYEANLKKYSNSGTKIWGNRTLVFECPKSRRPIGDWKKLKYVPFEFTRIPIPESYDSMLRQQYGDYMKIPEKKGVNMHGELILSTDHAYEDLRRLSE